jgi:hypothetical protein
MEIIEWLIETVFGRPDFLPVITTHTTHYTGTTLPLSFVSWSTKEPGTDRSQPLTPVKLKPNYAALPPNDRYESVGDDLIAWQGESQIPTGGPPPARLVNTRATPVFWARSYNNGGHVFIPVDTVDGDGRYAVALRTEVRLALVSFDNP